MLRQCQAMSGEPGVAPSRVTGNEWRVKLRRPRGEKTKRLRDSRSGSEGLSVAS